MPIHLLGLSAHHHDSAAVLLRDGEVIAAAQEERFTRKKHDAGFPLHAARYVLEAGEIDLADVAGVAFFEKPLLESGYTPETRPARSACDRAGSTAPGWLEKKMSMRSLLEDSLLEIPGSGKSGKELPETYFPEHHISHAASAFYPSPFGDAAVLTIDSAGEWTTTSLCHGRDAGISVLREIQYPHSIGLLYSAFTAYCGFRVNSGEYKLMGLAPYGNPGGERARKFERIIREELVDIREDGSYTLNTTYFNGGDSLCPYNADGWLELFGFPPRVAEDKEIALRYMDMALAVQRVTEDMVLRLAAAARELTGSRNLCLAGGVALNCVANGKVLRSGLFERMWTQPASGDAGGALGAALALWHIGMGKPRTAPRGRDGMRGAYLGPAFGNDAIAATCREHGAPYEKFADEGALCERVARLLADGKVVGWFQGRMEYGPRALGNRSILGDPRNPEMQKRLNLKIKYREGFRPFAPSALEEACGPLFDLKGDSPYMLLTVPVADAIRKKPPDDYAEMDLWERLYFVRSTLPAITHVDYSARLQTVNRKSNPRYWRLLDAFKRLYDCPVLVNTSFNVRGEPVVCTPVDAYRCFMRTEMDYLVMGDLLLDKSAQPAPPVDEGWRGEFALD